MSAELVFRDDNASTDDTSDVRISNVISDVTGDLTGLTFYPFRDARLHRSPSQVYSKIAYSYAKDTIYEVRTATATAFNGERGGTASNSNVKTSAKAHDEALEMLWQHHTEDDIIECSILVPASAANLVNHGDRIQARFSHLATEGYGSFTWFRVLEETKKPLLKAAAKYELHLKLSPQEAAPPAAAIVQRTWSRGAAGNCVPVFANPVTIGNVLLTIIVDHGNASPAAPQTSVNPKFGAGAWTALATAVDVDERFQGTFELYHGMRAYWKVADSTSQSGAMPGTYVTAFVWELAGVDMASASLVDETEQPTAADPMVMDAGSLGTVAVGDLAFYAAVWVHNSTPGLDNAGAKGDFLPLAAVAPGSFTERLYKGTYDGNLGPYAFAYGPVAWWGDVVGTGASVQARIQRPKAEAHSYTFGTTQWAAIGIKVPPL